MRKLFVSRSASLVLFFLTAAMNLHGQTGQPLSLVETILMPNVKGRLDHMYVDVGSKRLFVAGLENGSVEVVDLKAGKWLRTMPGFQKPQGILFVPRLDKIFVASGDDGMVRVFTGKSLSPAGFHQVEPGSEPSLLMIQRKKLLYVGYGGKGRGTRLRRSCDYRCGHRQEL